MLRLTFKLPLNGETRTGVDDWDLEIQARLQLVGVIIFCAAGVYYDSLGGDVDSEQDTRFRDTKSWCYGLIVVGVGLRADIMLGQLPGLQCLNFAAFSTSVGCAGPQIGARKGLHLTSLPVMFHSQI